ncbi:MAG TPA: MgtC/SapB family protein [Candidatus Limnocylindria bacterium]|nr:MgtC/SapB family protein [Candidatus Limnocylindria bacterium]
MGLPQWELILRLLVAAALGSLIGLERERLGWAAGLRTHMLVCVGSCLMMIVSAYGFSATLGNHVVLDPSRVAAQVVSGIGFLGAGSIILRNEAIKGLTTAASVWAVAGVGLAAGGGLYTAAVAATVIMLVILAGLKPLEDRYLVSRAALELSLTAPRGTVSVDFLQVALGGRAGRIRQLIVHSRDEDGSEHATLVMTRISPKDTREIVSKLEAIPAIRQVRVAGA